uniref:Uncharacterized protein n=1 Tax=Rhizophora mucronata TaxID=61149 RepID=A0A2P2J9L4_RHIMU
MNCQKAETNVTFNCLSLLPSLSLFSIQNHTSVYERPFHNFCIIPVTKLWNSMELKFNIAAVFLLSLLLATPCRSTGRSGVADPAIYEIDYRGPETHSSMHPPPSHSRDGPWIHRGSNVASPKAKHLRGSNTRKSANTNIHG